MYRERPYPALNGLLMVVVLVVAVLGLGALMQRSFATAEFVRGGVAALLFVIGLVCLGGFFVIQPNEAKALTLFGTYKGTVKQDGFWWANPFLLKQSISLRVRNFETAKLKVNDNHANPIEIGAIVVWKVVETAEALFEVDDYQRYVAVQSESALRAVASQFPYDAHTSGQVALSTHPTEVSHTLETALADRLKTAGVAVVEARISHLAYAQEIAAAMLQRQQASAIVAARQQIVEGAVGMVEMALAMLSEKQVVHLDEERKASMVSNLLVVLCSERSTQPVVNSGSLYS